MGGAPREESWWLVRHAQWPLLRLTASQRAALVWIAATLVLHTCESFCCCRCFCRRRCCCCCCLCCCCRCRCCCCCCCCRCRCCCCCCCCCCRCCRVCLRVCARATSARDSRIACLPCRHMLQRTTVVLHAAHVPSASLLPLRRSL